MTQEIIHKLMKASGVQPDELILIHFWGDDADKAIAEAFQEAVVSMGASPLLLQQLPKEARVVCELGFGLNPGVQELCGYTVLDEKAVGTFHIALGANTMFGGQNVAPLHLDLVGVGTLHHHPS